MSIHDKYLNGKDKLGIAIERLQTFCKGKRVLCAFSGGSGTLRSPRRASQLRREGSAVHQESGMSIAMDMARKAIEKAGGAE